MSAFTLRRSLFLDTSPATPIVPSPMVGDSGFNSRRITSKNCYFCACFSQLLRSGQTDVAVAAGYEKNFPGRFIACFIFIACSLDAISTRGSISPYKTIKFKLDRVCFPVLRSRNPGLLAIGQICCRNFELSVLVSI